MTINSNGDVSISKRLLSLILPIIISLITTLAVYAFTSGKQAKQVEINTIEIEKKVNKDVFDMVIQKLNTIERKQDRFETNQVRIEQKLDIHMAK